MLFLTRIDLMKVIKSTSILAIIGITNLDIEASDMPRKALLTLDTSLSIAQAQDPWLRGNLDSQRAIEALSSAADTLPDPKISMGIANIASDSFDFAQEDMTQFKVGFSQMFPRGNTRKIRKSQLKLIGTQFPFQRQDRNAKTSVAVSLLWLNAYKAQESIVLIEESRELFEQLVDVAQSSYASTSGKTRQHDIIRAQLEITRLEDRLLVFEQHLEMFKEQLQEWLADDGTQTSRYKNSNWTLGGYQAIDKTVDSIQTEESLISLLSNHPTLKSLEQKILASQQGIELAKQKFKPQWGLNASYGYRDDRASGANRSDLFSIGFGVSVPLFSHKRQDKELQSAIYQSQAIETSKLLLIRKMIASFMATQAQLIRLGQRNALYGDQLLPQMSEQAEAALTAYTNDDGDFAEVVRARIAELSARIDALSINMDQQKLIAQLNYFFVSGNEL